MRILIVHNRYRSAQPSGENRVVEEEMALLRAAGHDVLLFGRDSDEISTLPAWRKAMVPAQVVWSSSEHRRLRAVLGRSAVDVVHVHNTFPLISPSVLSACRAAGVP